MTYAEKSLAEITSRTILVFPPETIIDGSCYCRFEPDGIALIKGYLAQRGYSIVDLAYSPPHLSSTYSERIGPEPKSGWGVSPMDQEGVSLRGTIESALSLSLDSPAALLLKRLLPDTVPITAAIGLSIGFPSQLYHGLVLARLAKNSNPSVFVVIGGPLITSYISCIANICEMGACVDGIIAGYGEEPLAQLILQLCGKGDLGLVPNLYLSKPGLFQLNTRRWAPDKTHLRTIPDYGRQSLSRKFDPYFPVRPSIGCYWGKCAFCVYPSMSTGTTIKPPYTTLRPEELVEHLMLLMKKGSGNCFELCADSLPPSYLRDFSELVLRLNLNIRWNAWSCVDKRFLDDGVIEAMKRAGCDSVLLGIESASRRILGRINKMQTRREIDQVLEAFSSAGISLFLTFCIGFPGETHQEALKTIHFLRRLLHRKTVSGAEVRIYRFALMCNTPMIENLEQYGISSVDWSDMYYLDDDFTYHYETSEGMSFQEVRSFVLEWRARLGIQTNDSLPIPGFLTREQSRVTRGTTFTK